MGPYTQKIFPADILLPLQYYCYHLSIYWHHQGMDMYLPVVPFIADILSVRAGTILRTLTAYLLALLPILALLFGISAFAG